MIALHRMMGRQSEASRRRYRTTVWQPAQRVATRRVSQAIAARLAELRQRIAEEQWLLGVTRKEMNKGYVQPHWDALGHDAQRREVVIELLEREAIELEQGRAAAITAERGRILEARKLEGCEHSPDSDTSP